MRLEIQNGVDQYSPGNHDPYSDGLCAVYFVDTVVAEGVKKDATVVFRGTNGPSEWYDNALGVYAGTGNMDGNPETIGCQTITYRQQQALD